MQGLFLDFLTLAAALARASGARYSDPVSLLDRARAFVADVLLRPTPALDPAPAASATDAATTDGYGFGFGAPTAVAANRAQGYGPSSPEQQTTYAHSRELLYREIVLLGRHPLVWRLLSAKGSDALREGWALKVDAKVARRAASFSKAVKGYEDRLGATRHLSHAYALSRQWGQSIVVVGAVDGRPLSEPLDRRSVRTVLWLKSFGRHQYILGPLSPESSRNFGEPDSYLVSNFRDPEIEAFRAAEGGVTSGGLTRVHHTRCLSFTTHDGFSVLDGLKPALDEYFGAHAAASRALVTWAVSVFKIKNWLSRDARNREQAKGRVALAHWAMSMFNALILDADWEDHRYDARPMSGFPDMLDRKMVRLAADTGTPMVRLFGLQAKGFAQDETSERQWDSDVRVAQREEFAPEIERLDEIIASAADGPVAPGIRADWRVVFPPSRAPTTVEALDLRSKAADVVVKLVTALNAAGVEPLRREEILSQFSGGEFGPDLVIEEGPTPSELTPNAALPAEGQDPEPDLPDETTDTKVARPGEDVFSAEELASEFRTTINKIRGWAKAGRVGVARRLGRGGRNLYSRADVLRLVQAAFSPATTEDDLERPRTFVMMRRGDVHGVSGTGEVMQGVVWPTGRVTTCWQVPGKPITQTAFDSFEAFLEVHVAGHAGNGTEITFYDGRPPPAEVDDGTSTLDPFPNFHASRQRPPSDFAEGSIRTAEIAPGVTALVGELKSGGRATASYRFDKTKFTPAEARAWLEKNGHKTTLEEASQ